MTFNRFYVALAILTAWVVAGLFFVAPWLFATFEKPVASALDLFGLILPFMALSLYVVGQRRLAPLWVSAPVMVVIAALWLITLRNIYAIIQSLI